MPIDVPQPFMVHLEEARKRILLVLFAVVIFFGISIYFINDILWLLKLPAGDQLGRLTVFSPTSAILSFFKIAFCMGIMMSVPVFLYELWMFIVPALDRDQAHLGFWFITAGSLLFLMGAIFSFSFLIPVSLKFLLTIGRAELNFLISLDAYISFVLILLIGGGLVFETPVLVFILSKAGILTAQTMIRGWKVALVVILIAAGLLTPTPDVVNMLLMSLPMVMLYFISIGIAGWVGKRQNRTQWSFESS